MHFVGTAYVACKMHGSLGPHEVRDDKPELAAAETYVYPLRATNRRRI